jgi:hypothetical protein
VEASQQFMHGCLVAAAADGSLASLPDLAGILYSWRDREETKNRKGTLRFTQYQNLIARRLHLFYKRARNQSRVQL